MSMYTFRVPGGWIHGTLHRDREEYRAQLSDGSVLPTIYSSEAQARAALKAARRTKTRGSR